MALRTVWTAYRRMVEDFDSRDLEADSDREAAQLAAHQIRREQWPASLRDDLTIDSQEVAMVEKDWSRRRYALDLASDAEDLDLEEVALE